MKKNNILFTTAIVIIALVFSCFYSLWEKSCTLAVAAVYNSDVTVVVDAGHGGFDGGTIGIDGTVEKDINLMISKKVVNNLRLLGINTITTRDTDISTADEKLETIKENKTSDLKNRMKLICNTPNSILLSIHQNHYSQEKYNGLQLFYSPNDKNSEILASIIQDNVHNKLQPENNRQIKKAESNLFLLYKAEVPSVIVECGFMSNAKENALLKDEIYQNNLAFCLAISVNDYINFLNSGGI